MAFLLCGLAFPSRLNIKATFPLCTCSYWEGGRQKPATQCAVLRILAMGTDSLVGAGGGPRHSTEHKALLHRSLFVIYSVPCINPSVNIKWLEISELNSEGKHVLIFLLCAVKVKRRGGNRSHMCNSGQRKLERIGEDK